MLGPDPAPWLLNEPYITCPVCFRVSCSLGDLRAAYCGNCHQYHSDLPWWDFGPLANVALADVLAGSKPIDDLAAGGGLARVLLRRMRRIGLVDHGDSPTPAGRAWAESRARGNPPGTSLDVTSAGFQETARPSDPSWGSAGPVSPRHKARPTKVGP